MGLLARVRAVSRAVEVQDHPVRARPLRHRLHRRVADREVDHDDDRAEFLRELGALVHLLHRSGRHVHVVALDLSARRRRALDAFDRVHEAVVPAHERLRVDVLVVLREVEAAAERLVDDAAVVLGGEAELRLHRCAEERSAVLVEHLALHDDAVRGSLERLDVVRRDAHVLEAQRLERLEAEDVADDRGGEVRDRAFLEEIDVVGDARDELVGAGHRLDAVRLRLVVLVVGEPVGPDHRPGRRRRLSGNGGRGFDRVDSGLRNDPEGTEDVGVLRDVVGVVVPHLRVRGDACRPAVLLLEAAGR